MTFPRETPPAKPRIVVFYCSHCQGPDAPSLPFSVATADAAVTTVHFTCAREVRPEDIRRGFVEGADGVLICGCLVRNCRDGGDDLRVLRDLFRNQIVIKSLGLESDRLREEWILQGTTDNLDAILSDFSHHLRELGPVAADAAPRRLDAEEGRA